MVIPQEDFTEQEIEILGGLGFPEDEEFEQQEQDSKAPVFKKQIFKDMEKGSK